MIRTRWFVVLTLAVVAVIGVVVYRDETARSEASLVELGKREAELARVAALAPEPSRVALHDRDSIILIAPPNGEFGTLALTGTTARLDAATAASLGLPARTAMAGIAPLPNGGRIAAITSAEHQRDRDFAGRTRVVGSMALAAAVMTAFTLAMWWRQRKQAALARDLAVAETARSRDAELDRLYRAATMAALGSGVAHELSTPLGVIVGRAEQLLSRVAGDDRATKNVQVILEQTEYINQVVRGLLGLARGAPIALQTTDAHVLVEEATALVHHRFVRAGVNLVAHNGSLPDIRCEPLLFKHALINLLLNACDASPPKSTVRVDVEADTKDIAFIITDEGEGITREHAARATEPFFTTKPSGTGLGLAIANEIAKTHRGTLELAQVTPHGTRACITIPLELTS